MHRLRSLLLVGLAFVVPATAHAAVITYSTPSYAEVGGFKLNASATFTTTNGGITVLLENLQSDPLAVIQAISGIQFIVENVTTGSLTSNPGTLRTIASDGTFVDAPVGTTDWSLSFNGPRFHLTTLNASGASRDQQLIIGAPGAANTYRNSNAPGSIAGNNQYNPFLALSATFQILAPGVTDQSEISNVILLFGTQPTASFAECTAGCPDVGVVPEPTSLLLLGSGLFGLTHVHRKRRARGKPAA
jgi:hypothetical protein